MIWLCRSVCALGAAIALSLAAHPRSRVHAQEPQAIPSQQEEDARTHFQLGRTYYDQGRFAEAAREFMTAYRLSERPQLLYNVFLAYRDAGEVRPAVEALSGYLDAVPDAPEREHLTARLEAMRRVVTEQDAAAAAAAAREAESRAAAERETTARVAAEQQAAAQPTAPSASTPARDRGSEGPGLMPWIIAGGGGALLIGSSVFGAMALGVQSDLESSCPNRVCPASVDLEARQSEGNLYALVSDGLLVAGIAGVGVGAYLYFFSGGDESDDPVAAGFACATEGCIGQVSVRF